MIINEHIQKYIIDHIQPEPSLLYNLRKETYYSTLHSHMLCGVYQGRFLSFISKFISPNLILELGTFTGYSALCLAEGLNRDGKLITMDINDELKFIFQKYFAQSKYKNNISFILDDALNSYKYIQEQIDICYIDADKNNLIKYFDILIPYIRKGGIIIYDNTLWYGKVTSSNINLSKREKNIVKSINNFNKYIKNSSIVESIILPIRDGINIIRKK